MVKTARAIRKKPPVLDANRAAATLCRRSFAWFVREFWDVSVSEPLIWENHMDVLCIEMETALRRLFMRYDIKGRAIGRTDKEYDLVINIPPGTSKSTIISVMAPIWAWINDPTLRFLTTSYSGRLSEELAVKSRDILRSPKFRLYFPGLQIKVDEDGKRNYKTTKGGQRFATSILGTATGQHAHCIIIDDPVNPKQAASQKQLQNANDAMDSTLNTRKVNKAVTLTVLLMQRVGVKDPTGHLLSKKGKRIRHINLPATISPKVKPKALQEIYVGGLLSPLRMGQAVLDEMRIEMGSYQYASQMQQSPIPQTGGIWKKWFIEVEDDYFPSSRLMTQYGTHWDLAYTEDQDNSASAWITGGRIADRIYIDDIGWEWLEFPELLKRMKSKPKPHYIEAKASGKSAKQTLTKSKRQITAIEVKVIGGDKVARANMATPVAESGVVYIRKSLADRLYNDDKQGILVFPKGAHDDLADVLAQFLQFMDGRNEVRAANERSGRSGDPAYDEDEYDLLED